MSFTIPSPLKLEHEELHAELVTATQADGRTGEAATAVAKVLHEHFMKEEEFALPPLGLLPTLAQDELDEDAKTVLNMTARLKSELYEGRDEHNVVVPALKKLIAAAEAGKKPD